MVIALIILIIALAVCVSANVLLKADIRQMARQIDELTDTNAKLTTATFDRDVTVLATRVNGLLDRQKRVLLERDRAEVNLKRAITNISHDLRTPLTAAIGYLQMLDERERYVPIIKERLTALSALLDSFFEFARAVEGNTPLSPQRLNLCAVLRDVLSAFYMDFKDFTMETDIPETPLFVICDENALRRVLQNLFRNAAVHGKGFLRVTARENTVTVANGTDFEVDAERIFERFYTSDPARTGQSTGLGLAIAREIVTRMGGDIFAEYGGHTLAVTLVLR
jgi:signal transduction histidine kinase